MEESPNKINAKETRYFIAKPKAKENRSFSKFIHTLAEYLNNNNINKKIELKKESSCELAKIQ